jgi:iron complex outermembrane recepter protein
MTNRRYRSHLTIVLIAFLFIGQVSADTSTRQYHIPAQPLNSALMRFASDSNLELLYTADKLRAFKTAGLDGSMTPAQALSQLLQGSGMSYRFVDAGTVTIEPEDSYFKKTATTPDQPGQQLSGGDTTLPKVTVEADAENPYADPNWATDPYNHDYNRPNATTATKTDTPVMETPVSVQVVPRGVLADKQSITLPDAVNGHVSGVLGRTGGGYLYDNFIIRGLPGSGFGDAYRNGLFNRQDIYDIANIEQIDILKGPAAVLYGRIEPGGLVNYVTKKPLATPYYSLQQQFGSYDQYRTQFDATGPIDKDKHWLYRFNGSYSNNESFRDFVGNERFFVAPVISWRPNDKFTANFELEYKHDRFNADNGTTALARTDINGNYIVDDRPAPIPISRSMEDGRDRQVVDSTSAAFDWTYRFNDDWKFTHRYLFKDWTLSGPILFTFSVDRENGSYKMFRSANIAGQDVQTHSTNFDLNGKFEIYGTKHNFLFGVDGFLATTDAANREQDIPPLDIFNPEYGQVDFTALEKSEFTSFFYRKESWFGAYIQDQITLFDKWHILLGGRYDNVTTGGRFTTVSMNDAIAGRVANKDDNFSPRGGILYQPFNWLSLYGSYSESFSGNNGIDKNNKPFDPQRGKQYELGIKTETPDKRFSSTLAFFHLTKTNLTTDDRTDNNQNFQVLVGKIRSKGIELDVAGQITDNLNVLATYAYTQAEYTQSTPDFNKGLRLENVPRHQGSVWGTWQFNDAFKAGLGVVVQGRRYGDPIAPNFSMPGYARLDAMASYTYRMGDHRLTAQVNLNNLLDKQYYASTDGSSTGIMPGAPINVFGSLKYEF